MNKKASMELGISTVVVLVIAMVIIAGGIAFIRGFFNKGTEKLGSAFNVGDFGVQPTAVDSLVLVEGSPSIKSGSTEGVKVGFYNKDETTIKTSIIVGSCVATVMNPNCPEGGAKPIVSALPQDVKPGESAGFETFMIASCKKESGSPEKLAAGDYICQLKAVQVDDDNQPVDAPALAEAQITLTITS